MINNQRLLNTFLELVHLDGVSGNEHDVAVYIKNILSELNIKFEQAANPMIEGGNCDNLIATLAGTDELLPAIMLSAHMDSIEPTAGINVIIEDGVIKTDGKTILAADDRAGIACILEIARVLKENKIEHPPIKIVFTVFEERGMKGAKNIDPGKLNTACGFIFDSSAQPGKIIANAPTSVHIIIKITGKSAHAAIQPEDGINAIKIAGNAIAKLETGRLNESMTFNFGKITGGKAINIVPDFVEVEAECRSLNPEELKNKLEELKNIFESETKKLGGSVEIIFNQKYSSFNIPPDSATAKIARSAIEKTGLQPELIKYPGGSDANVFNNIGIPSVNFGMGYRNAHSTREYISVKDLQTDAQIVLNVVKSSFSFFKNKED